MLSKIKAFQKFRIPETAEELPSYLGLVSYVGKFITNLSIKLDLLHQVALTTPFT